jgi:CRISPR-associated protein Csd1
VRIVLHQLLQYAKKNDLVQKPGFKPKMAKWAIVLSGDGKFIDLVKEDKEFLVSPHLELSQLIAGGKTRSHFLLDTVGVIMGITEGLDTEKKKKKLLLKHESFKEHLKAASKHEQLLNLCADALQDTDNIESMRETALVNKAKPNDSATLCIGGVYPLNLDTWHDYWFEYLKTFSGNREDVKNKMLSILSGEIIEPLSTHPKISGLHTVGGQAAGTVLIGFDKDSFKSYGLEQSLNAACSDEEAAVYSLALGNLIANSPKSLAGTKHLYWYKENLDKEFDFLDFDAFGDDMNEKDALTRVKDVITAIEEGKAPDLAKNRYYILTVSATGGRIMVRNWMEGDYKTLAYNILTWFNDLSIVSDSNKIKKGEVKLSAICIRLLKNRKGEKISDTFSRVNDELKSLTEGIRISIINNLPLPSGVQQKALSYIKSKLVNSESDSEKTKHADNNLDPIACGLLKTWFNREIRLNKGGQEMTNELNEDYPSVAYQTGRMMAVLAYIQEKALGDVGAGIVQRYYSSASSTPALVMGRLVKLSRFHLEKIDDGGKRWLEKMLANICKKIGSDMPETLTLKEQTLFALGYYHQRAELYAKKSDIKNVDVKNEEGE